MAVVARAGPYCVRSSVRVLDARSPTCGRAMAGFAYGYAIMRSCVGLGGQPVSCGSVAAGTAGLHTYIGVELGAGPGAEGLVAYPAQRGRWYVIGNFPCCTGAVVAAGAVGRTSKGAVIGLRPTPAAGALVAALAWRTGLQVAARLARGHRAVVTTRTVAHDDNVGVHLGRLPTAEALVAHPAHLAGLHVRRTLARGARTVMAVRAVRRLTESCVIHLGRRHPPARAMAAVT